MTGPGQKPDGKAWEGGGIELNHERSALPLLCLLAACSVAAEPPAAAFQDPVAAPCPRAAIADPDAIRAEAVCLAQRYVRIDTTNPPGNEAAAAQFIRDFLAVEGIEATIFESAPGRANVYARLEGDGSRRALMLVHHMDVVPAVAEDWTVPPFDGVVREGYLWGRGSLDNKGPGIMELLAFALLKRLEVPLARDVVLLGVADEEQGGSLGARYMVERHFERLRDVEFALNEGGAMLELADGQKRYSVEFAQKVPLWLKVTAQGPPGHGSRPGPDAAPHRLVRALARLEAHRFPITVVPAAQAAFARRAESMPAEQREAYASLEQSLRDPAFRDAFMQDVHNAVLVRNTLAITMLSGSQKENVLPAQASAVLDMRLLPGQRPDVVVAELQVVMNEPSVRLEPILSSVSHSSPIDTELLEAIGRLVAQDDPEARVVPDFIAGFTDCNTFRARGIVCYGFMPMRLPIKEIDRVHGRDERIATRELADGTLRLLRLVRDVAERR